VPAEPGGEVGVAGLGGEGGGVATLVVGESGVAAGRRQPVDDPLVAVGGRRHQWRPAAVLAGVGLGAGVEEVADRGRAPSGHRGVEGLDGHGVAGSGVGVSASFEEEGDVPAAAAARPRPRRAARAARPCPCCPAGGFVALAPPSWSKRLRKCIELRKKPPAARRLPPPPPATGPQRARGVLWRPDHHHGRYGSEDA
jgi:hypothetical protein